MFNEQRRGPAVIFWLILLYIFILACSASIWTCWNSFRDFLCRQIQISWLSSFWMAVFVEESNSNKDSPKQNQGFLFLSCVSLIKVIWVIIKGRSRTDKCWINNVFKRLKVKAFLNMLYLVGPHFAPKTVLFSFGWHVAGPCSSGFLCHLPFLLSDPDVEIRKGWQSDASSKVVLRGSDFVSRCRANVGAHLYAWQGRFVSQL